MSSIGMSLQRDSHRKRPDRLLVPSMPESDPVMRTHTYSNISVGYSEASLDRPISPLIEPI